MEDAEYIHIYSAGGGEFWTRIKKSSSRIHILASKVPNNWTCLADRHHAFGPSQLFLLDDLIITRSVSKG